MEELNLVSRDLRAHLLLSLAVVLLVLLGSCVVDLRPWEARLEDTYFRLRGSRPDDRIVLIEIDQATVNQLAPTYGQYPYLPALYARLLAKLNWESTSSSVPVAPGLIAFADPLQPDPRRPDGTRQLVTQLNLLRDQAVVWLASSHSFGLENTPPTAWAMESALLSLPPASVSDKRGNWLNPAPAFAQAAYGGVTDWTLERDGICRQVPLAVRCGNVTYPELGYAMANQLQFVERGDGDALPTSFLPTEALDGRTGMLHIDYTGAMRDASGALLPAAKTAFRVYSLADVLAMPAHRLHECFGSADGSVIVLVGPAIPGVTERIPTPCDPVYHYPVEMLAHVTRMHLDGSYPRQGAAWHGQLLALLLAIALGISLPLLSAMRGGWLTIILVAGLFGVGYYAFAQHFLFPILLPLATVVAVYPVLTTHRLAREERRRRALQRHFAQYLSADLVLQLMESERPVLMKSESREVSILFADLRNFTSWAATRDPKEVVTQLNDFLAEMSQVIEDHGGTVDKFIGDAVMAIFGAPSALENHARSALSAALEMQERLDWLSRQWDLEGRAVFQMGVAVHSGEAVVGEIGAEVRRSYTAIGTTVNVAARLEEKTKELGVRILATHATCQQAGELFRTREVGAVTLRGVLHPVLTYEILERIGIYRPAPHEGKYAGTAKWSNVARGETDGSVLQEETTELDATPGTDARKDTHSG